MTAPLKSSNFEFNDLVRKVSAIVAKISGNVLEEKQALMVQTRVKKRMSELGLKDPADYLKHLDKNIKTESQVLVSLLTTHHTFFFREFAHFEYLKKNLPEIISRAKGRGEKKIKIWSAACSRGQEVYSLSMFLNFYLPKIDPSMSYEILGSDIDPESVKIGQNGVYHKREIKTVPMNYLADHWARGTGDISDFVKAKKSLTDKTRWKALNLLDFSAGIGREKFDIIFCRNVFIYFRPEQIKSIVNNFMRYLEQGGLLFSGISESLGGLDLNIKNVGPSIYVDKSFVEQKAPAAVTPTPSARDIISRAPAKPAVAELPDVLRVLCVDDSSSVLTLLKKIFSMDKGFEVVGTAKNGVEAHEFLKNNKGKVDIMTLDIHMPELDGVSYLGKYHNSQHPPVVMISSASREDSSAAMKAIRNGASDFIEKPALNNLMERGEEIKTKLKVAYMDKALVSSHVTTIDKQFEHEIKIDRADTKFRMIMSSIADQKKVEKFFKELVGDQPPTVMFYEGQDNILEALKDDLKLKISRPVEVLDNMNAKLEKNKVYLADFSKLFDDVKGKYESSATSMIVFGKCSSHAGDKLIHWNGAHLLIEDINYKCDLSDVATDIVPATSFAYMSCEYLSKK